jgi:GDP-L-fucose synthase
VPTTIRDLANIVVELTGFAGTIHWDASKPDGQLTKVLDVTRMRKRLGYTCRTSLREGLKKTVAWFDEFGHNSR